MGSGIAQLLLEAGIRVTLADVVPAQLERARAAIERGLARRAEKGELAPERARAALAALELAPNLAEAGGRPQALIEAVVEELETKRAVFQAAAALLSPDALLLSNTSSLSITRLAAGVVRGERKSPATVAAAAALARRLGKTPVVVQDSPGFVVNRLLLPMINEAGFLLLEGVAGREAIDTAMQLGANHPLGPLRLADLIGLDVCLQALEVLHRELGEDKYRPCPLLRRLVAAGKLGRKTGAGFYEYGP